MATPLKNFSIVKKTLADYDFPGFTWVYCRPTVADLFKPDKRCGIYILRFRNDEYYIGQAVDVIRRYVQHTKVHDDIEEITFKCFPQFELNQIEQELVRIFEAKKIKLRNINLTSIPKGDTDLDLVIPRKEQENWLATNKLYGLREHFNDQPDLRDKYSKKFYKLIKQEDFQEAVYPFLKEYFSRCVLQPAKTELSFWSLTCLVKAFTDTNDIALCRLNLFWCEVLTIWLDSDENVNYTFHLTKSILTKTYLNSLRIKSLIIFDHFYQRGGPDQFSIDVQGIDDALKLLQAENVVTAIKTFNLRQMQKGATVYSRYHCIDLAKLILTEEQQPQTKIFQ